MKNTVPTRSSPAKKKRRMDLANRQIRGELDPAMRMPENSKAYNRVKAQD